MTHPGPILFQWLTRIPPAHAAYVAHLYLICTSENMDPFFLTPDEVLGRFKDHIEKRDLPLRIAARMVGAIAVFDLILVCQVPGSVLPGGRVVSQYENIIDLNGPLWKKTVQSWAQFSQDNLSPKHVADWLLSTTA